ncbi:MAG: Fic family protein, partial [Phycisphaerales bacterium]|nr:Fic family protein [Phycisphaerales bacterium]
AGDVCTPAATGVGDAGRGETSRAHHAGWEGEGGGGGGGGHPVIHAAVVAFGFVFMHPFDDGNGRIHRFLIHNILAHRKFTPHGMIFPVSAVMLQDRNAYDRALEAFSTELMPLVEYDLDDHGRMTVQNDTARHYRYIDMTAQTEALFGFIQRVIEVDLVEELKFLQSYDTTKEALQEIVDMPDRFIDLFIRLCLQNHGTLSAGKRKSHFEKLTNEEVSKMEAVVKAAYLNDAKK